jgi:pyruvate/2-oxoglutarate dehydrogenase complex dihydrolipoamide acyltransferase (E2) component
MIYSLEVPGPIADVEQIRVLEWHGEVGQRFELDELIVELETHKALVEVRAGQAGVLREIVAEAGDWKGIGETIALFSDSPGEALPQSAEERTQLAVNFEVV